MGMIPYGRQDINDADIAAVVKVLTSDFLTQGPVVPEFEKALTIYCGAKFGVAVNSATSALHLACLALGVGADDIVWTTPITFVASANCAVYCGAKVDFVDIDPKTYNLSVDRLAEKLDKAEKLGLLPKVVIPVHLCGQPCDMAGIFLLGQRYGFKIIEDASHALGGRYKEEPIGNCRYSDITVFSFHPVKIITAGEGGCAVTNSSKLAGKMARLRSHGITRDGSEMVNIPDGPWYYEQIELGYNYRMTDIQAALVLSQMLRLDEFVKKRHVIASRYDEMLRDFPAKTPTLGSDGYSSMHLYVIRLNLKKIGISHREIFERFRTNGVGVNLHYIPIYRHPYYAMKGYSPEDYPEAEQYYSEAISLPIFPTLDASVQLEIIRVLNKPIGHQTLF
jgi:UDP-4-amino-4,6-dideoxy-N-acetyl-beta-L-altrosamine transaminase